MTETMVGDVAADQGWTDETVLPLVLDFVRDRGLYTELVEHLRAIADAENAEAEAYMDVCSCGRRYTDGDADEDFCSVCRQTLAGRR